MFPAERRQKIMEMLHEEKMLHLQDLTEQLGISMETIRRDIAQLIKSGEAEKVYGGIKLPEEETGESLIDKRLNKNLSAKVAIARKCAAYIADGDTIYLDSGSTTLQIAKMLKHRERLTVVTNSLPIMLELANSRLDVISIGGRMRHSEQSITSYDFLFNFEQLNIQKAFICTSGITLEKGISDYNLDEVLTRRKIIGISDQIFVVSDSSKFHQDVTVKICDIEDVDILITDNGLDDATQAAFDALEVELVIAEK